MRPQMYICFQIRFPDVYTNLGAHSEKNIGRKYLRGMGRKRKRDEEGEPLLDSKIGSFGYKPKACRAL